MKEETELKALIVAIVVLAIALAAGIYFRHL
jgi:hypothetical protein